MQEASIQINQKASLEVLNVGEEKTPVIKFAGLNEQGGKDIVAGYIAEFGENVFAEAIKDKLV